MGGRRNYAGTKYYGNTFQFEDVFQPDGIGPTATEAPQSEFTATLNKAG